MFKAKRIFLLVAVSTLIISTVLGFLIASFIKKELINLASNQAASYTYYTLDCLFPDGFQTEPLTISAGQAKNLDKSLQGISGNKKLLRVKIWNLNNTILYSDDKKSIGKVFTVNNDLKRAYAGETVTEVSDLKKEDNLNDRKQFKEALEIYIPIHSSKTRNIIGAYELYWDLSDLNKISQRLFIFLTSLHAVVLFILFISLYTSVKKVSKTIEHQSKAIVTLTDRMKSLLKEKEISYLGSIQSLLAALDAKDNYTAGHSVRVADMALKIAKKMNLSDETLKLIEEAALFHDIGKIGISEAILNKPGPLTEEETILIRNHAIIGANIIEENEVLFNSARIIRHHHEHYDGTGYPDRLKGDSIPLESRILAVADVYDAITSNRAYLYELTPQNAIDKLIELKNTYFDPEIVDVFIEILANQI